nr:MAG TPA: Sporulation-specific N-acetylmuramoyl-L-alanine amidase [Caudoviricetes sp.]
MAVAKKTAKQNNAHATTQESAGVIKKAQGYKVIGKHFKNKNEANNAIKEIHKKGFKVAGLCVRENEFVILFGSYDTAAMARVNLAAIKTAGFTAEIE